MNTDQAKPIEYNIVVVFKEMRFTQVLDELAIKILPEHPAPLITKIPGQLLSIIYPDRNIHCQFANKRVQVSDKRGLTPGEHPFGLIASGAIKAAYYPAEKREDKIVSYGYNYAINLKQNEATSFISSRFFSNCDKIQNVFKGNLRSVGFETNIFISQKNCLAKFVLNSQAGISDIIIATINFHYESQIPPDTAEEINQQATSQYDEFFQILEKL